jgi:Acetyltransferase (GNAT) domain
MTSLSDYEDLVAPARERFAESFGVRTLQLNRDAAFCELFLMYFCALGVHMTKPVEGWIRRAAARCTSMGLSQLGDRLSRHAAAEADHHLLMIADLQSLAARWNARRAPSVDADALLGQFPSPGVVKYYQLHEENIAGESPFAQVAIEYEIEMLPLRYGNVVVERCIELLGTDILSCLSFITKHIALDGAHTDLNAGMLADVIQCSPWSLSLLAAAGSSALDAYAGFIDDCVQLAQDHARSVQNRSSVAQPTLRWKLKLPSHWTPNCENKFSSLEWLKNVGVLRGRVLFDNGRRPGFRTPDGGFLDPDPIDAHAFHILACDGARLVGCVRLYHLEPNGPLCVTERILGERTFSQMLQTLDARRTEIIEIGRWIVDPGYRATKRDLGLSIQLVAASGALAKALGEASGDLRGFVICAAGTKDRQDMLLTRVGMVPVSGIGPIYCEDYKDDVRILCCSQTQRLNHQFMGFIDKMAKKIGLDDSLLEPFRFRLERIRC